MKSRVLVSIFLLAATALGQSGPAAQRLVVPETRHDFGDQPLAAELHHVFTLRNAGDSPLHLTMSSANLTGLRVRFRKELAPGAAGAITVDWNTAGLDGELEGEVGFTTDDPALPSFALTLRARLYAPVAVEPQSAAFFSVWRGESAEQRLRIVVRGETPAQLGRLVPAGTHFTAAIEPIRAGREYDLIVRVSATDEVGRFRERLTIATDHPEVSSLSVAVNVLIKPELYASPESLELGEIDRKALAARSDLQLLATQTLLVRRKEGEFEILSLESDSPALTLTADPAAGPAQLFRIDVGFAPDRLVPGPFAGTIRIKTSDPRFPALLVPYSGTVAGGD